MLSLFLLARDSAVANRHALACTLHSEIDHFENNSCSEESLEQCMFVADVQRLSIELACFLAANLHAQ